MGLRLRVGWGKGQEAGHDCGKQHLRSLQEEHVPEAEERLGGQRGREQAPVLDVQNTTALFSICFEQFCTKRVQN